MADARRTSNTAVKPTPTMAAGGTSSKAKLCTKTFIKKLIADTLGTLKTLTTSQVAKLIQEANYAYYNQSAPLFTDAIYDIVKEYLEDIDPNNPVLKEVGSNIAQGDNRKEKLPFHMGSLDKIKTDPNAIQKFKSKFHGTYIVSDKLDGNSALYHNGKLYSRGNGTIGQNITSILPHIHGIPNHLPDNIAIRGELIISKANFTKIAHKGANARNMVAGAINAKIPDLEVLSLVEFKPYEVISPADMTPHDQMIKLFILEFDTVHHRLITEENLTVETLSDILIDRRKQSPYEVDGIVVAHNAVHRRNTSENPEYAFAFKSIHTMDSAEVIVSRVEWNISKDAYIIPTVIFNPVNLNGVVIQRATGFNGKFIKDNTIGPGSKIVIIRSGDVIPKIEKVLSPSETGEPQMPNISYTWSKTGVDVILDTPHDDVAFKSLEYFINKIDIPGLSGGNLKKLFEAGIRTPSAIFTATKGDLLKVDGFKEKLANKLYTAIQDRYSTLKTGGKTECILLMDASNAFGRGIGSKKLELILEHIPNILTERYVPSTTELVAIKGVEIRTAEQFLQNLPTCFKFLDENGFSETCHVISPSTPPTDARATTPQTLVGQVIVFTGVRSKEVEELIIAHGGKVTSSVSKHTTTLLTKSLDSDSSSMKKARELGIPIFTLEQWQAKMSA